MREDPVSHEIRFLNGDGDVIHTVAAEPGYDPSWVFHRRFHPAGGAELPEGVKRYEACLSPSRVILRGRFALDGNPSVEAARAAFVQEPSAGTGREAAARQDGVSPSVSPKAASRGLGEKSALPVPHGIDGSSPGFPPAGYRDYLYVQVGRDRPHLVNAPANVRALVQSLFCTLAVFADGSVSGLGYDPLAYDTCSVVPVPPKVKWFYMPPGLTNVVAGTTSWDNYFMFLLGGGKVCGWGGPQNVSGRDKVPKNVTNAAAVVSGSYHAAALLPDGNVAAWGDGWAGQTNVPPGLRAVTALAAGDSHTLALLSGGRVAAWGDNYFGQTNVPSYVTNAVAVAAGFGHSVALLGDGRVAAWGDAENPEEVTGAVGIAAGWDHSAALLGDGSVYAWGDNSYGQCSPPAGLGLSLGVSACFFQTGALLADGSATVWGGSSGEAFPETPLSVLGQVCECRVLQTAFAEDCTPCVLMAIVRAPAEGAAALDGDADGDALSLFEEQAVYGTDSGSADSDGDGLSDGQETLPFLTLWEPSNADGVNFFGYDPVKVAASDSMRAALLRDGRVVVFTGEGQSLKVYTNACGAVDIDASDSWIAALLPKGDVSVMRENSGTLAVTAMGYTNVVEISGGLNHLLLRHAGGKVSCLKEGTSGAPTNYTSTGFSSVTNAVRISAGSGCDAAQLASYGFRLGNALSSATPAGVVFDPEDAGYPVDVSAGSNQCYAVLFDSGAAAAYRSGTIRLIGSGVVSVAANGDRRLLAVMGDGGNRTFSVTGTAWENALVTNDLLNARSLWWRRDCRVAVSSGGALMPISGAAASGRRMVFQSAAVTPGGLARGIAVTFTGTCATNAFSDADPLPDGWEFAHNLNPLDASDAFLDSDGDGLINSREHVCGTDPFNRDSDGDGYEDGWEALNGFDPADPSDTGADPDGDGLTDAREYLIGTNKNLYDTDGDGLGDGAETEIPFLTLWDFDGDIGRVFTFAGSAVTQVTASDNMRAALLDDGREVVFTGRGSELKVYTNACGAVEIDATDAWVAARRSDGGVTVCREVCGTAVFEDAGLSGVTRISGGYRHLLVLHESGNVTCLTNSVSGVPVVRSSHFCSTVGTNAAAISAGTRSDAAFYKNGKVLLGDALSSTTPIPVSSGGTPYDIVAGSNKCCVVLLTNGLTYAFYYGGTRYPYSKDGTLFIAGGGCSDMIATQQGGTNWVFSSSLRSWSNTSVTNRLTGLRDLWARRDCRLAVKEDGTLSPQLAASASGRKLDFYAAAVTPRGGSSGIAAACSGTCPTNSDSDADGVPDGAEVVAGLNPLDPRDAAADSDADGIPDWWEKYYGLNPADPGDASSDPDRDGLDNLAEYRSGSDPLSQDTDGDGLPDGDEVAHVERKTAEWFDTTGGTNILSGLSGTGLDGGMTTLQLPFPVFFDGSARSNMAVSVNGAVWLLTDGRPVPQGTYDAHSNLSNTVVSADHVFIAGYWGNLRAYPEELGSSVTVANVVTNGCRACVIAYRNMGFGGVSPSTNDRISFQIVLRQAASNRVAVSYLTASGMGDGRSASVGVQGTGAVRRVCYSYDAQGSVRSGLGLELVFGWGTLPYDPDTDGDGMPDGWEAKYGLNPLDPADRLADADGDGLKNYEEWLYHTNPLVKDTDGDGMDDFTEVGSGHDPTRFNHDFPDSDGDGLPDLLEQRRGTNPQSRDTNGDGMDDDEAILAGRDPAGGSAGVGASTIRYYYDADDHLTGVYTTGADGKGGGAANSEVSPAHNTIFVGERGAK